MRLLMRAAGVWVLLMAGEVVNGTVRTLLISPHSGDFRARQIGVIIGSVLIVGVVLLMSRWLRARSGRSQNTVGLLWVILTVAFEIGLGRMLHRSWAAIRSDFDLARGGLLPIGLLVMMFSPMLTDRLSRGRATAADAAPPV